MKRSRASCTFLSRPIAARRPSAGKGPRPETPGRGGLGGPLGGASRPPRVLARQVAEAVREAEPLAHADAHRLAVQEAAAVARERLVGVGEGVAEIEQRA